jgi:flagellar biosynthetic protein FlhB
MSAERPFAPTRERLRRAAREGDLPRSADLTSLASFAAGSLALAVAFPPIHALVADALRAAAAGRIEGEPYLLLGACIAAICSAAAAAAVGATVLQMGRFVVVPLSVKLSRLQPAAGLKRMASREALLAACKAVVAAAALGVALAPAVRDVISAAIEGEGAPAAVALVAVALPRIVLALAAIGAVFAGFDLALAHASRRKRLHMTMQEYKDDLKSSDGDPGVRLRRRTAHRALSNASVNRLREAAFVVVNPQHIAVALEYHPPAVAVPRVLLRAHDAAALEVRRRAAELSIPVIEDVELARALHARTAAGDYIPNDLYGPVARIVAALAYTLAA